MDWAITISPPHFLPLPFFQRTQEDPFTRQPLLLLTHEHPKNVEEGIFPPDSETVLLFSLAPPPTTGLFFPLIVHGENPVFFQAVLPFGDLNLRLPRSMTVFSPPSLPPPFPPERKTRPFRPIPPDQFFFQT